MSKETVKNLEALRSEMQRLRVDAVIIPGTDPHQSEYVSDHWKLRDWVSGFTGSNGTAVVTADSAGLWTDSRYFLQASQQLQDSGFDMHKEDVPGEESINEWIATHLPDGAILAVDGYLFSITQAAELEEKMIPDEQYQNVHMVEDAEGWQKTTEELPTLWNEQVLAYAE